MRMRLDDAEFEMIKQRFDAFWDRDLIDRPLIRINR